MASQAFRPTVEFDPNKPQIVALKYAGAGRMVDTRYGQRVMFTLVDDRVMFLDLGVAQRINELGINVREPFSITKEWSGRKGEPVNWVVERLQQRIPTPDPGDKLQEQLAGSIAVAQSRKVGEQQDGTFVVPGASGRTPAPVHSAHSWRVPATAAAQQRAEHHDTGNLNADAVLAEARNLTDVYAAAWKYARERYEGQVKPEEVKSFVITAYIQRSKGGPYAS